MILFEFLCENQKIVDSLIGYGIIPVDIEFRIEVYTTYLRYRENHKRVRSIELTASDHKGCFRNIYSIIQAMERETIQKK